jgi:tetraacyldisaccharide 4'-kinase
MHWQESAIPTVFSSTCGAYPFPDHHAFTAYDLEFAGADAVVMTEKDAIKCQPFARENHWVVAVDAQISPGFGRLILDKLKTSHGS